MQASPIRKLVPLALAAKEQGKKVYHLNIGQPDIKTPPEFMAAVNSYDSEVLAYAHSQGYFPLIDAISHYYERLGMHYGREHIVITNGGSEALQHAFVAICNPGDEILVPEPFYTNYRGFSLPFNVEIKPITCTAEDAFALPSKEKIQSLISDRTRAILVSNPGNPTGVVYSAEEVEMLRQLALENDLFLIGDEVYREFAYDGDRAISFGELEGVDDRVILIDSVSKRFSACGARIGCLISRNTELIENVIKLAQARLCAPTLEMVGSTALFELDPSFFEPIRAEYKLRRDTMIDALQKMPGVLCLRPKGAFYAIAKLPVKNAEDFVRWLLSDFDLDGETVMLAPVENFYQTPGLGVDEVRLAYVLNVEDIKRAMRVLAAGLEAYPGERK